MYRLLGVPLLVLLVIKLLRKTLKYGSLNNVGVPVIKPTLCFGSGPFLHHTIITAKMDLATYNSLGYNWATYSLDGPTVFISEADIVKQIYVKSFDHFQDHWFVVPDKKYRTLADSNGEEWRDLRKGLSPTFTSGKIKAMLELMEGSIDGMIEYLDEKIEQDPVVDMKPVFQKMALDVISKCAFGVESNSYKDEKNQVLVQGKALFDEFMITDMTTSLLMNFFSITGMMSMMVPAAYGELWKISKKIQTYREETGTSGRGDFIDRIIELKKQVENGDLPSLSLDQITAQGIAFIAAGFETTASTLGSLCYNLVKNPNILETLLEEIDETLEKHNGHVSHDTISDMPYLDACLKETLRIAPAVARSDRVCTKDWDYRGLRITAGTIIIIPIYVVHHNPHYWPQPETFSPQRFFKENAEKMISGAYLPFGGGPRVCIGERFAMVEMKMAMVKLLKAFMIEHDQKTRYVLMKGDYSMLPYEDIFIKLKKRKSFKIA